MKKIALQTPIRQKRLRMRKISVVRKVWKAFNNYSFTTFWLSC